MFESARLQWAKCRKVILSGFVIFYCGCTWLLACPKQWLWPSIFLQPLVGFCDYFGAYYDLILFTPNSPTSNTRYDFEIDFNDGSGSIWNWPAGNQIVVDRKLYDRYLYVYMQTINNSTLSDDMARFLARKYNSPQRQPVLIRFIKYVKQIPAPGQQSQIETERKDVIFAYKVSAPDLQ